ncbi:MULTISPECIES: cytochrome C [Pseudomonadota]|uniref:cytochrome C n=1 Tax=Pseudomonadota TaxID=1224 RepID=UPI0009E66812|nr:MULTISPECIES: cytochrome C [Pseudomonadota]MBA4308308.1 cytochrome C [Sphingopyxis sp.]
MKGARLLYVIYALALALLVVVVPLVTHSTGSSAVTGWTSLVSPGPLSPAHTSFQNKCETCHTPHKGVEPVKCIACHIGTDFGTKASTRFHANAKQCTTCHIEHDGGASLTRMNHVALLDPALWRTPPKVEGTRPPTAFSKSTDALSCASCHAARDPHQGLFGNDCKSCHTLADWKITTFRHPSVNSRQCAECHKAPPSHFMMHFKMVSQRVAKERAPVNQCVACHTTDSWNNIRKVGWYDHH